MTNDASGNGQDQVIRMTKTERLMVWLLAEILKNQSEAKGSKDRHEDNLQLVNLIQGAISGGHLWALEIELPGIFGSTEDNLVFRNNVIEILDMWDSIETGYERLTDDEKRQIGEEPKFHGFDGNYEAEYYTIALFLVEDLGRFERFKGRGLNSHVPMLYKYRPMVTEFQHMQKEPGGLVGAGAIIQLLEIYQNA